MSNTKQLDHPSNSPRRGRGQRRRRHFPDGQPRRRRRLDERRWRRLRQRGGVKRYVHRKWHTKSLHVTKSKDPKTKHRPLPQHKTPNLHPSLRPHSVGSLQAPHKSSAAWNGQSRNQAIGGARRNATIHAPEQLAGSAEQREACSRLTKSERSGEGEREGGLDDRGATCKHQTSVAKQHPQTTTHQQWR